MNNIEEQFSYLSVDLLDKDIDNTILIKIDFSLYNDKDLFYISQHDQINVIKDMVNYKIRFHVIDIPVIIYLLDNLKTMVKDRQYVGSSNTDRVGYMGMLVSALHQFQG